MIPVVYSEAFLDHETGLGHPERADRLRAVVQRLQAEQWVDHLSWQIPKALVDRSPIDWIQKVHDARYIEQVRAIAERGGGLLDGDTPVSARSYEVACLAVNAWLDGIDWVLKQQTPCFVLARPPGHHALPNQGMGFCIFSNAAIAAFYGLAQPSIERVAILDWDVHHGNGTQAIVQDSPQIAYCSLHQSPCYPGTGSAQETGSFQNVLNIPMQSGGTIVEYDARFKEQVIPFLTTFAPDLLIVSAGYDANHDDPLAGISLQPADYGQFTTYCLAITPRILLGLEGGYDLDSLAASVEATLNACLSMT
jgi:acetoin utilization deacetylase AcuC-like enzyme